MSLINPGGVEPNGTPRQRGVRSRMWAVARKLAESTTGRSRLWSWLWEREFYSLLRDKYGRAGS